MSKNREAAKNAPFDAACVVDYVAFTIGAESSDIINAAITCYDANGNVIAVPAGLDCYLSDVSTGIGYTASAPTTVAAGTNGKYLAMVTGKLFKLITTAAGLADINLTYASGAATWYLVVCLPDGGIQVSGAITFA